jgi:hypothetical protein
MLLRTFLATLVVFLNAYGYHMSMHVDSYGVETTMFFILYREKCTSIYLS